MYRVEQFRGNDHCFTVKLVKKLIDDIFSLIYDLASKIISYFRL